MKLFRMRLVTEAEIMVYAEDGQAAHRLAQHRDTVRQELDNNSFEFWSEGGVEVKSLDEVPEEWKGCIPYGAPNDETVDTLLKGKVDPTDQ